MSGVTVLLGVTDPYYEGKLDFYSNKIDMDVACLPMSLLLA